MNEISIQKIREITPFWVFYEKDSGAPGNSQLSACANNFAIQHGGGDGDGLRTVGLRYEKNGFGYYELFNVGHACIRFPLKPGLFGGKKAAQKLRRQYEDFEATLNSHGWKTIEETN